LSQKAKKLLRSDIKKVTLNLDSRWTAAASSDLRDNLLKLINNIKGPRVNHILAWTTFFPGEADLAPFINDLIEDNRAVYLPRIFEDRSMQFIRINREWRESSTTGVAGIPEPHLSLGDTYDSHLVEETAVIVPGLAFDREGNRLGRGMGYYDRFLASKSMIDALKIGVCFSIQLLDSVPFESHDIPVDFICTENETIRCKP
jgi:5-formyltetrahydrofolate cyclo-ligase